jgi:CheY-like chemotaxis protein
VDQANRRHPGGLDTTEGKSAPADPLTATSESAVSEAAHPSAAPREQTVLDWLGHELRNPIAAIELAVHAMRGLGDQRLDHPLSILERQTGQLSGVVLEVLEMARGLSRPASDASGAPFSVPAARPRASAPIDPPPERARGTEHDLPVLRAPAPEPAARRRLLLVEDNDDLSGLLRDILSGWGFEVDLAATASSALATAAARPPDVALIDIGLPDRDGSEVARALRRSLPPDVCLIAMSGYGQRHDGARALAAGFDEYLVKPLNMTRLRRLLGGAPGPALAASARDA